MNDFIHIPKSLEERIDALADSVRNKHDQALPDQKLSDQALAEQKSRIKKLLQEQNAVLVSHYYVDGSLQDMADETGGTVSDSLEMARFGMEHEASTVIVAGVKFMGETAKILSPEKRVLLLETEAECSLDIGCPIDEFSAFCDQHPDRVVVVYANTSAAVKARADWVVTSSIALEICTHLKNKGEKIIWGPDRFLGEYIKNETGADMVMWQGSCIVHEEFKSHYLEELKKEHPEAAVLVHPESPASVVALADVVGSTSKILKASRELPNQTFIVATEDGIFHKMHEYSPDKTFISAPTGGDGATCKSCAACPWMKMNSLDQLEKVLTTGENEINLDESIRSKAEISLKRMVGFSKKYISSDINVIGDA